MIQINISVLLTSNTGLEDLSHHPGSNHPRNSDPMEQEINPDQGAMLGLLPHSGKSSLIKRSQPVLQRVAYVDQKSAIDFTFPWSLQEITRSYPPFYLR